MCDWKQAPFVKIGPVHTIMSPVVSGLASAMVVLFSGMAAIGKSIFLARALHSRLIS